MDAVMKLVQKVRVSPRAIFRQAAMSQDPQMGDKLSEGWYHEWLVEGNTHPVVQDFCHKVLTRLKHQRPPRGL